MWASLSGIAGAAVALVLFPVGGLSWPWQILMLAVPLTALALVVFRFCSNQAGVRRVQRLIQAHLLEMRLFSDDLGVVFRAQNRVLLLSIRYLLLSLPPLAVMILPVVLILVQVEARFAYRALAPGESAMLVVGLDPGAAPTRTAAALVLPPGVQAETQPLRIDALGEIRWRLRARTAGEHTVQLRVNGHVIERPIAVGGARGVLVGAVRRADDPQALLVPASAPLAPGQPVRYLELRYPRAMGTFAGLSMASWALFAATMVLGFALRGRFGVTF
ncbi:MAG: hypothetical protein AB7Q97_06210 [Gammaproteobacteria bacterium]